MLYCSYSKSVLISGKLIVSRYVAESITMIAGRFGHVGLCQLRTKLWPKRPASVVIDSATDLLTISLPDIDKLAMSLYDINCIDKSKYRLKLEGDPGTSISLIMI